MLFGLYEVTDHRNLPPAQKLAPIVLLDNTPGRLNCWEYTGNTQGFDLTDDNSEQSGQIMTLYTDDGMISFQPLHPDSDVVQYVGLPYDGLVQDCLR